MQQAVLSAVLTKLPLLESLELAVTLGWYEPCEENLPDDHKGGEVVKPSRIVALHNQPTGLPALRSLALCNLLMSDAAMDQLLGCCPQLLELMIHSTAPSRHFWPSLMRCRQLLSFCFSSSSAVLPKTALTRSASLSSSSASRASAAPFPCLAHLSLAFGNEEKVSVRGFNHLLGLFTRWPIKSVGLCLPYYADHDSYVWQLGSLPRVSSLQLEVFDRKGQLLKALDDSVVEQLEEYSVKRRWSSQQHHVLLQHYWRCGAELMGEDEDELRAKYAAGVKTPLGWPVDSSQGWRVFAASNMQTAFFDSLDVEDSESEDESDSEYTSD